MKLFNFVLLLAIMISTTLSLSAQDSAAASTLSPLQSGSIEEQFDYVITKSNKYQDYKVVKKTWLSQLKSNVNDSILQIENTLKSTRNTVSTQQTTIDTLNQNLAAINSRLDQTNKEKDSIFFFGMLLQKGAYKGMMWGLVAVLFILMSLFVYRFRRANVVTKEAQARLEEIQVEFETFRKNSREKEQKLKRELQDEINKSL